MHKWKRQPLLIHGHEVMTFSYGGGPKTLMLIHGGPGCPSLYLRDSHEALATKGWQLVTWDQLGCGESPCPPNALKWSLERSVDEMEAVRSGLGLGQIDILGQSWGGVLGLEYVLRHRQHVRRMVAANTAFDIPRMQRGFESKKLALGTETCTMMSRHEAMGMLDHPEYKAAITLLMYRHICRIHPWPASLEWCMQHLGTDIFSSMFGPFFFQCTGSIRDWSRMDALPELDIPVLLVHGEHDYIAPELANMARELLPNSKLAFFPGCSHMPFFEDPDGYIRAVSSFLSN
jgi:proline iminopeptidase